MRRTRVVGLLTVPLVSLALLTSVPSAATAATTGQTFADDPAGWTSSSASGGVCVQQLLCPAVDASYAASGGTGGAADGYLRTAFSSVVNTGLASTVATWQSPAFTYAGVDGQQPTSISVDLSRRAQLRSMLPVDVANTSSFRVDLVDATSGVALTAVDTTALPLDSGWTTVPTVSVDPARMTIGHDYALRISTSYSSLATVTAAGEVGYDDVVVSARRVTQDPPVEPEPPVIIYPVPTPTPPTAVLPNPSTTFRSTRELRQYVRSTGLPSTARLTGTRAKVKVSCSPLAGRRACKYSLQGLSAGKGSVPATNRRVLGVQPGQTRTVTLTLRPQYLKRFPKGARLAVRANVRVGVFKVTVVKRVRLR